MWTTEDFILFIFALLITPNLLYFCYLTEDTEWSKKAWPSIILSYGFSIILWLYFDNYKDFSIWPILAILICSPIIGGTTFRVIYGFIKNKGIFLNTIYSFISISIMFGIILLYKECGCTSNDYNESQDRLMERRMMLKD